MATVEYGPDVNLKELRGQLADRVAWTLIGVGTALVVVTWPLVAFWPLGGVPAFVVPLAIGLVALGWSGRALAAARPSLAR
ncbi:MAG TPA: hypothetical protein VMY80_12520, partial [Anaerolineae bacterium]|nr:hypothetical protein [Anaerolineae bacterium]